MVTNWKTPQWRSGTPATANSAKETPSAGATNLELREGHILKIVHLATGFEVEFPAFLNSLGDAYSSNWAQHEAYGRMDSMATFGSTKRNISVSFSIPSESYEHAQLNLERMNMLIQFLYPLYDNSRKDRDPVINMDPYWRLSFGNLIRNPKTGTGLLGYVNGITFDPELEHGMFHGKPHTKVGGKFRGKGSSAFRRDAGGRQVTRIASGNPQNNSYYPKSFAVNMEFKVLHEHSLGFSISEPGKVPQSRNRGVQGAGKPDARRVRATYAFHDPKLNFNNYPYEAAESDQIKRRLEQDAGIRTPRPIPQMNPDPVIPGRAIASPILRDVPSETAQPSVREFAPGDGVDGRKYNYVLDPNGNIVAGERVE